MTMGELTKAAASMTAFAVEDEVTFTAGMAKPIFFAAAKSSITWPTRANQYRFENALLGVRSVPRFDVQQSSNRIMKIMLPTHRIKRITCYPPSLAFSEVPGTTLSQNIRSISL